MQTMSAGMATLLKSGKQIGVNKPSHEVIIGGSSMGGYTLLTERCLRGKDGLYEYLVNFTEFYDGINSGGDVVERADGKFLIVYQRGAGGADIYLSVLDTIEEVLELDNLAQDNESNFTSVDDEISQPRTQASFLKLSSGKILLFIANNNYSGTKIAEVKCYESANGLGTDFTYKSTVYSNDYSALTNVYGTDMTVGKAIISPTGRVLLPVIGINQTFSTAGATRPFACYSDDDGATWSSVMVFNDIWSYGTSTFKGFGIINTNRIIAQVGRDAGAGDSRICYSDDDGATWDNYGADSRITLALTHTGLFYDNGITYYIHALDTNIDDFTVYAMSSSETIADVDIYDISIWGDGIFANAFGDEGTEILTFINDEHMALVGTSTFGGLKISHISGVDIDRINLQAKSIQISRSKGMAGQLTVEFDNKDGILAPDGTTNLALLWPNKEVTVKQGYGTELIQTFNGLIDNISMSTFPQTISINVRDKMKALLDHLVRDSSFSYVLTYTGQTVEAIWQDLITKAGLTYGAVGVTGITLTEKIFSWQTYADCISWLDEITGFETYCDEFGVMHFVYDGRPTVVTTAYQFVEGIDIIQLGYDIDDKDLYYSVVVYGKDTNDAVIYYAATLPQAVYWNIPSGKVMRIDAPDADTSAKCQAIADKAIYLMQTRARQVRFSTIGIPHLQRGDFIQVTEASSTISEIYRITDISTSQDSSGYRMQLTCYYHAAPEV